MRNHTDTSMKLAKRLRREMSLPEVLLWQHLRGKPRGLKFRNQHPVGDYVLDFYCHAARTAVEVDGIAHDMGDRPARDERRDAFLRETGLNVLRLAASEVLKDPVAAAESILGACEVAAPPPSALRAATSPGGGGLLER